MTDDELDGEMLRDLQRRTAELPREIAPPESAWQRIADQIASEPRIEKPHRVFWQRPTFLAAAALLLVAASSITTAFIVRERLSDDLTRSAVLQTPSSSSPATLAEFTARENDYIATVNALSAVIEGGQVELAPGTVEKLRESIRIIDAAIIEARRALAADPSNKALMELLSTSYGQKVDLLRRTAAMGES